MKKIKNTILLFVLFYFILNISFIQAKSKNTKNLKSEFKKFLNEVNPIITPKEKKIFYALKSNKERTEFIALFWGQRDPTPLTKENEFKSKYLDRLIYVNQRFGREEGKPGWATERGRYYLVLGKPKTLDRFDGAGKLYPTEVWFYNLTPEHGVPPNFRLVFFAQNGNDFKLYNPNHDGPSALIGAFSGDVNDTYTAYEYLKMWEPSLAPAAISLIPSVRGANNHTPPMENITLITNIQAMPQKRIDDNYAEMYYKLKYKVDVDVSLHFVKSKTTTFVSYGRDKKMVYLNFVIQPDKFSIERYEDKYYTKLNILFNLYEKKTGKRIFSLTKNQYMPMGEKLVKKILKKKINIALKYPIASNKELKYLLYIKNLASKEYFMHESEIIMPEDEKQPYIVDMVLSNSFKEIKRYAVNRPFQLNNRNIFPSIGNIFRKGDKPFVTIGVNNPTQNDLDVKVLLIDQKTNAKSMLAKLVAKKNNVSSFFVNLSSDNNKYGYKTIRVELKKDNIAIDTKEYTILYSALKKSYNNPLSISINYPDFDLSSMYYYFSTQYDKLDNANKAEYFINKSLNIKKSSKAVLLKVELLYKKKQFSKGLEYLKANTNENDLDTETEFLMFKGYYETKNLIEAEKYGNKLVNSNYRHVNFLNMMGYLSIEKGNISDARLYFRNSLKLKKDQKIIKDKLNELSKTN